MHFTSENILLISSILIFCSILISKAGYRFGLPSLLLFLIAGMLFGSDGLGLQFNNMNHAQFIGMIALCVILFTGGRPGPLHDRRPAHDCVYWSFHLPAFRMGHGPYLPAPGNMHPSGRHNVFNGFRLGIQHPEKQQDETEEQPSAASGARERK